MIEGLILEKPRDEQDAYGMLARWAPGGGGAGLREAEAGGSGPRREGRGAEGARAAWSPARLLRPGSVRPGCASQVEREGTQRVHRRLRRALPQPR